MTARLHESCGGVLRRANWSIAVLLCTRAVWLTVLCCLGGCVATLPVPSARVEGVPFYAQEDLQCGPAALASLLQVAGVPQPVSTLTDWMFTPALGGALQQDLLGAARRAGTLPVRVGGNLAALQRQLSQGRPVLVLENLALRTWPRWHYAVVTGIDAAAGSLTLSGPTGHAETVSARHFTRAWDLAENWAIVVLRPGTRPSGLRLTDYLDAVATFEAIGRSEAAAAGYAAGLREWPDGPDLSLGAGNVALARGQLDVAAGHFAHVLASQPQTVAALNNLAEVRRRQGDLVEAKRLAQQALVFARAPELRNAVLDTLRLIATCGAHC